MFGNTHLEDLWMYRASCESFCFFPADQQFICRKEQIVAVMVLLHVAIDVQISRSFPFPFFF